MHDVNIALRTTVNIHSDVNVPWSGDDEVWCNINGALAWKIRLNLCIDG